MTSVVRVATLAIALLAAACAEQPTDPSAPSTPIRTSASRTDVCHVDGSGSYRLITVADPALPTHIGHGDAVPLDPVPGMSGKRFTASCGIENIPVDFVTFFIRNANGSITPPWDADMVATENPAGDGYAFATPRGGQKVGYGTTFFDGRRLNQINTVTWTALGGMGGGIITYLNIWVTDGNGNYAVISSENQYPGTDFLTRTEWKVFESAGNACGDANSCPSLNWLFPSGTAGRSSQYLYRNGARATLADFGDNIVIQSPSGSFPSYVGTGAPRGSYGFNLIWGDTQANFAGLGGQIGSLVVTHAGTQYPASN